jgi:hypothetical protein
MKRCPQCDFLYEDDQSLCDMDGILLVYDSRKLPHLQALSTTASPVPTKQGSRNHRVPALASVLVASVLVFGYYVSTKNSVNKTPVAPIATATTLSSAPVEKTDVGATRSDGPDKNSGSVDNSQLVSVPTEAKKEDSAGPASDKPAANGDAPKKATTKPKSVQSGTSVQSPPDKDSKVESFFKKTGRLLSKPFKK